MIISSYFLILYIFYPKWKSISSFYLAAGLYYKVKMLLKAKTQPMSLCLHNLVLTFPCSWGKDGWTVKIILDSLLSSRILKSMDLHRWPLAMILGYCTKLRWQFGNGFGYDQWTGRCSQSGGNAFCHHTWPARTISSLGERE